MRPRDPRMTISMRPVGFLCVRDAGRVPSNITVWLLGILYCLLPGYTIHIGHQQHYTSRMFSGRYTHSWQLQQIITNEIHGVFIPQFCTVMLSWARDNLSYEPCHWCRINCLTC